MLECPEEADSDFEEDDKTLLINQLGFSIKNELEEGLFDYFFNFFTNWLKQKYYF